MKLFTFSQTILIIKKKRLTLFGIYNSKFIISKNSNSKCKVNKINYFSLKIISKK